MAPKKGTIPWNKGKLWSDEVKQKISIAKSNPSLETRKKISNSMKKFVKENPERVKEISMKKRGIISHRKGISMVEEYGLDKARSVSTKISSTLRKNQDSGTREKLVFNQILKNRVKKRDNNTCQLCRRFSYGLHVHHIDYDKSNNLEENLISLCPECHGKTNGKDWWKYKIVFKSRMFNYEHFIPEKSKLWLNGEYKRYTNQIINPFSNQNLIEGI